MASTAPKFRIYSGFGKPPQPDAAEFAVQVVAMKNSFYVWVGPAKRAEQRMDNLAAALQQKPRDLSRTTSDETSDGGNSLGVSKSIPSVATIFQDTADDKSSYGEGMAERISQLTGCVAFVSFNLSVGATPDHMLALAVEKLVSDLTKKALAETL